MQLLGLEPDIRAGVPNVAGGPIIEVARLGGFRPLVGIALITRTPSLYNAAPNASFTSFIENMPLRNLPTVTDTVPGASAIQETLDRTEWAQQAANPAAYAPFIQRPVIIQFARGDKTVPNPTTSAILRACGCATRATLYRNDLAYALNPAVGKNPHTFLTNIVGAGALYALEAQAQIATFFASDGKLTIDPDGRGRSSRRRRRWFPRTSRTSRRSTSRRRLSGCRRLVLAVGRARFSGRMGTAGRCVTSSPSRWWRRSPIVAATAAIFMIPWEGVAAIVVLAALHVALGLAVGRWWVLLLPIPLLAILLAPSTDCTGDLCGNGVYAFFLVWYAGVACALVAVGVGARRLIVRRLLASAARAD